ncbi:MAG: alpha/beta hydrolase [Pyrinomonadaceae bacterium]
MDRQSWFETGTYLKYGDHRIFYRTAENDRETLLCLHGFPTSSFDYHKVWPALSEEFSLVAFDMIGYGFSDKPADFNYTTSAQVDILQALLADLKIERLHLLSHDYGNTIVQELLARREETRVDFEIDSICFLNGALFPETHRPILAQKILIGPFGPIFGRLIPDARFKGSLSSVFGPKTRPTDEESDDFIEIFKYNGGRKIAHRLIQYMRERTVHRERWVEALRRIDRPFRLINGLADPVSGAHLVERFREIVPHQKDIIELNGVGHFPHFEVPEIFLKYFFEFHGKPT